ncbi:MAG: hypothetical protein KDJ38_02280 [Gammaproteobacteria bacterium]|nr:hypothetical protein [Gammaproteobacteria bacterium]
MSDLILELENITQAQTMALAQFVKRIGWQEISNNAIDEDEAYTMRDAIEKLQKSLARKGLNGNVFIR